MRRFVMIVLVLFCAACGHEQRRQEDVFAGRWVGELMTMQDGTRVASCTWNLVPAEGSPTSIRGTWSCSQPLETVAPRIGESGALIGQYGESNGWRIAEIAFAATPGLPPFKMDLYGVFDGNGALYGQMNVSGIAYDNLYVDFSRR